MATEESKTNKAPASGGSFMNFVFRFMIFFGLSFFLLSLPINRRPLFYHLHQVTVKAVLNITGMEHYQPTFHLDKAQTGQSAPLKKNLEKVVPAE